MKSKPTHRLKLILGEYYKVGWYGKLTLCKLIQPTRKGFNFLDVRTNKCLFKAHMYDKRFSYKKIPKKETEFKFVLFNRVGLQVDKV